VRLDDIKKNKHRKRQDSIDEIQKSPLRALFASYAKMSQNTFKPRGKILGNFRHSRRMKSREDVRNGMTGVAGDLAFNRCLPKQIRCPSSAGVNDVLIKNVIHALIPFPYAEPQAGSEKNI
jgi:hypothetical protein